MEEQTGKRQSVEHLHVWGCVAYVHIPKERGHSKLQPRSIEGRFISVDGVSIYLVLIPAMREIYRSRDVVFAETPSLCTSSMQGEYSEEEGVHNYSFIYHPLTEDLSCPPDSITTPVNVISAVPPHVHPEEIVVPPAAAPLNPVVPVIPPPNEPRHSG